MALFVPLEFAQRAWALASNDKKPLLRQRRKTDLITIVAYGDGGDGYNLEVEEYAEEASSIETFTDVAAFLGMTREGLIATWKKRGLPEDWIPDGEDDDDHIADPWAFLDELDDLSPMTRMSDIVRRLPREFKLSAADKKRAAMIKGLKLPDPLGEVMRDTARPGDSTVLYSVQDAFELSCFQYLLDARNLCARVRIAG